MKHVLALVVVSLAIASSAFAATPTTEPSLPSDIGAYKTDRLTCDKYAGKVLVLDTYRKVTSDSQIDFKVISLNGQKVEQQEYSTVRGSQPIFLRHVRNSPDGNWLKYDREEGFVATVRLLAEIGLTYGELDSCND